MSALEFNAKNVLLMEVTRLSSFLISSKSALVRVKSMTGLSVVEMRPPVNLYDRMGVIELCKYMSLASKEDAFTVSENDKESTSEVRLSVNCNSRGGI